MRSLSPDLLADGQGAAAAARPTSASPPNPTSIMAQVDGSGTVIAREQAIRLAVDAVGEEEGHRVAVGPPPPNIRSQRPPGVLPGRG